MVYVKQDWVNGVTPLDETHMDYMEDGIFQAVASDSVVAAASRLVASKLLAGDTQPAFRVLGDGKIEWGPGGTTAPTVNLYRSSTALKTDNGFQAGGSIYAYRSGGDQQSYLGIISGKAGINFGPDVYLYRDAATSLKTDGSFTAAQSIIVDAATGGHKLYFGGALAEFIWRRSAGVLGTNVPFRGGGDLIANVDAAGALTANSVAVGHNGSAASPHIAFGATWDTLLYRVGVAALKTDGKFVLGNSNGPSLTGATLLIGHSYAGNADSGIVLHGTTTGLDAPVSGGFKLKSDGSGYYRVMVEYAGGEVFGHIQDASPRFQLPRVKFPADGAGGDIIFGNDTSLYRTAANQLKTGGSFQAGLAISANDGTVNETLLGYANGAYVGGLSFGSARDTYLYRSGVSSLRTGGSLFIGTSEVIESGYLAIRNDTAHIYFGSADDTYLTRDGANSLRTSGSLAVQFQVGTPAGYTGLFLDVVGIGFMQVYRRSDGILTT